MPATPDRRRPRTRPCDLTGAIGGCIVYENHLEGPTDLGGGRSFYALALASALACTLLALRVWRLHSWGYAWLTWNLILAWVPYLASLWADRLRLRLG